MTIRIVSGRYQPNVREIQYKKVTIRQGIVAFLYSTFSVLFQKFSARDISKTKWIVPFLVQKDMEILQHSGRSPPFHLIFSK